MFVSESWICSRLGVHLSELVFELIHMTVTYVLCAPLPIIYIRLGPSERRLWVCSWLHDLWYSRPLQILCGVGWEMWWVMQILTFPFFSPHSTRSASSSKAAMIISTTGWARKSTFTWHYQKSIVQYGQFVRAVSDFFACCHGTMFHNRYLKRIKYNVQLKISITFVELMTHRVCGPFSSSLWYIMLVKILLYFLQYSDMPLFACLFFSTFWILYDL